MNKLIKKESIELAPTLTKQETRVVLASASAKIIDVPIGELLDPIVNAINEAILITGQTKLKTEDVAVISKLVIDELKTKYPSYKIDEIKEAIHSGAFGEFEEEVVYVSAKNLITWCKKYQERKHQILVKQLKYKDKLREEESRREDERLKVEYYRSLPDKLEEHYNQVKNGEPLGRESWVYFKSLRDLAIIKLKPELRDAKLEEVTKDLEDNYKARAIRPDFEDIHFKAIQICREFFYNEYLKNLKPIFLKEEKKRIKEAVDSYLSSL